MIKVQKLRHSFHVGKKGKEREVKVLKGIDFEVKKGEIVSIVGKSGSGKSTLLQILAGFLKIDEGSIVIKGKEVANFNEKESAAFRLENFGFVFQNFQLLPGLNVAENIEIPLKLRGVDSNIRKGKVDEILERVGLTEVFDHYPNELSGGQQQRVAIARALINEPPIILADEPTGSLDTQTEKEILDFIKQLNKESGITFVIITHDDEVASIADKVLRISDGLLVESGGLKDEF